MNFKYICPVFVVILLLAPVQSGPINFYEVDEVDLTPGSNEHPRFRRVTCDLLSVDTPFGSLNHAACAANCIRMRGGRRGGSCHDGVCHCRF